MLQTRPVGQLLDPMTILQNCWYNCVVAQLGVSPTTAQIIQPSLPIVQSDQGLWRYPDQIPPTSLTFNISLYCGDQFFHEYAAMAIEQAFPDVDFQRDIGQNVYTRWQAYVDQQLPPPTPDQLPALFQKWAAVNAPNVVNIGVSDLVQMALIADAQQALNPYLGSNAKPADFGSSFAQFQHTLQNSPGVQFSFDSSSQPGDVSQTWTGGINTGIYGLWSGYANTARLSRHFATSKVTAAVNAQHYLVWTAAPGNWYNSSLLNNAYSNSNNPPWPADADPTWNDIFGPTGSMPQLITSLLIMDGVHINVTSDATYTEIDQQTILSNGESGLWPFFIPGNSGTVSNTVLFDQPSGMSIDTVTQPGNPIVVGANVLKIASYLGQTRN